MQDADDFDAVLDQPIVDHVFVTAFVSIADANVFGTTAMSRVICEKLEFIEQGVEITIRMFLRPGFIRVMPNL